MIAVLLKILKSLFRVINSRVNMYNFTKALLTVTLLYYMGYYIVIKTFYQENDDVIKVLPGTKSRKILINKTRTKFEKLIDSYNPISGVRNLEDFAVKPLRVIIISPWGSGSTYLAQLLNSIPDVYFHYEPLASDGLKKLSTSEVKKSLGVIRKLLKCNYEGLKDYLQYVKNSLGSFSHNSKKLWALCKFDRNLCYTASFISQFCKIFPFQVMKVVWLRLDHMINILRDTKLNVKLILLVRDPRDVLQSRYLHEPCHYSPDCLNPSHICADMISNHITLHKLKIKNRSRVMVLRYETLAQHTEVISQRILKFLNVSRSDLLDKFIKSHKELETLYPYDNNMIPKINISVINNIQVCKKAMKLWNYKIVKRKPQKKKGAQLNDSTIEAF